MKTITLKNLIENSMMVKALLNFLIRIPPSAPASKPDGQC